MKEDEVVQTIKQKMAVISDTKIYYTLRTMKLSRVTEQQMLTIKIFLALRDLGMTVVNTNTVMALYGRSRVATLQMLHELGDKGVLTLVRNQHKGPLRYILSAQFTELYDTAEPKVLNRGTDKL